MKRIKRPIKGRLRWEKTHYLKFSKSRSIKPAKVFSIELSAFGKNRLKQAKLNLTKRILPFWKRKKLRMQRERRGMNNLHKDDHVWMKSTD